MMVTLLRASDGTPLTKVFRHDGDRISKQNYPHVLNFDSEAHEVTSLTKFRSLLANPPPDTCLLKGNVTKPLSNESRAGSTNSLEPTPWVLLDVDGLKSVTNAEQFMTKVGLGDVSYIEQLSSSAGIDKDRGYSAHIFVLLEEPMFPAMLKLWLMDLNLKYLNDEIKLNKAGSALKWPLDISTCQNDKLIYIADPVCQGFEAPKIKRLTLKKKQKTTLAVESELDKVSIKTAEKKRVNELRKAAGLPKKNYKLNKNDLLLNPDKGEVTGTRSDRGFTYININGGDSWGYYFPTDNPEVVYNFKGEPNVRLKDIAPEYYESLKEEVAKPQSNEAQGVIYEIGVDVVTDKYMRITYDQAEDMLDITYTGARANAFDFLKQHGQPKPDFIPTWETYCDFRSFETVNFEKREINRHNPTDYMRHAKRTDDVELPPTVGLIVRHVFGNDNRVVEHFLNWLAFIFQNKKMTNTSWVIGGTQGTGKGLLFDKILTPILGPDHCGKVSFASFESEFNGFMEDTLLLFVDEVQISGSKRHSTAMANIKKDMANSRITIRKMRTNHYVVDNYANFIFATNKFDAIEVDQGDRRFNVAPRQEEPLRNIHPIKDIDALIENELQAFTNYLMSREVDREQAMTIIDTEERRRLQATTENTTQAIANRLREGDFEFFIEDYAKAKDLQHEFELSTRISNPPTLFEVMNNMYQCRGTECKIPRDHLAVLFFYFCDVAKSTPHAFTKFLGYHGFDIKVVNYNNHATRGVEIPKIHISDEAADQWLSLIEDKPMLRVVQE